MNKLERFINIAQGEVGYKENGTNLTKYAKYFDTTAWQFFNTKKQGAEWCAIFIHWCLCQIFTAKEVRKILGEPDPKDNCGAGVKFLWNYMKKTSTQVKEFSKAKAGDIIFFNEFGHVGMIEYVDDKIHTIEGNKSNMVKRCAYTFTSKKISGIMRMKFPETASYQPFKLEPAVNFDKFYAKEYEVMCNCQLLTAVRKNVKVITVIKKGTLVRCYGYYTGNFLFIKYGNYEGYICKNHLR